MASGHEVRLGRSRLALRCRVLRGWRKAWELSLRDSIVSVGCMGWRRGVYPCPEE